MTLSGYTKGARLAQIALCLGLLGCAVALTLPAREALQATKPILIDVKSTTSQIKATAYAVQNLTNSQRSQIEDANYQRKFRDTVLLTNSMLADVQTNTLPRVNKTLDGLTESTAALQAAIFEAKAAIAVNGGHASELLVEAKGLTAEFRATAAGLTALAAGLNVEVPEIAGEFKRMIASGAASTEQVNKLLADPKLPELLAQAERLVRESGDIAVNVSEATAELPPIMKTARRFQIPLNVARILSVLLGVL